MDTESRFAVTPRTVVGLTIALVGAALMLDRLGLDQAHRLLRYWPVPVMLVGGLMFVQAQDSRERFRGAVVAGIGTWLFLNAQGLITVRIWDLFWPLVLILFGISLVFRTGRRGPRRLRRHWNGPGPAPFDPPTAFAADSSERISMFSVMSHVKRASSAPRFRGGEVTAFMGGGQLDLRLATIAPGEEAVIDILAVMGGVELFVPGHWEISTPILPFMGGVEDKRLPLLPGDPNAPRKDGPAARLVLRGFVMMGGVQIKG